MKLYVWTNVLEQWQFGIAFALAESENHARRLIMEKWDHDPENPHRSPDDMTRQRFLSDLSASPTAYESAVGFFLWGSS